MTTTNSNLMTAGPLEHRIIHCTQCPRLITHCRELARIKRRAYRDQAYWGKPVPPFGVADPRLLVVGLAPGGHGANRTGRIFTGDSSGDWLYRAMHVAGFANQARSVSINDGLELIDAVVTCPVRCAPPQNRPTTEEQRRCRPFLIEELRGYPNLVVVIALGRIAFDAIRRSWPETDLPPLAAPLAFDHGAEHRTVDGRIHLICSYHPSRQNTQTGRLTRRMFHRPFRRARVLVDSSKA